MGAACEGSVPDLRGHLGLLLDGSLSVPEFWTWFVRIESAMESCASDDMFDLYLAVEAVFAEFTSGHLGQRRLLERIALEVQAHGGLEGDHARAAKRGARVA
jgi:hypothetical protein